jgi:hypothetical protein
LNSEEKLKLCVEVKTCGAKLATQKNALQKTRRERGTNTCGATRAHLITAVSVRAVPQQKYIPTEKRCANVAQQLAAQQVFAVSVRAARACDANCCVASFAPQVLTSMQVLDFISELRLEFMRRRANRGQGFRV